MERPEAGDGKRILDATPLDDEGVLTLIELDSKHPVIITANTQVQQYLLEAVNKLIAEVCELETCGRRRLSASAQEHKASAGSPERQASGGTARVLEATAALAAEDRSKFAEQMKQCRILLDACNSVVVDLDGVDFSAMKVIWGDERSVRQSRKHLTQLVERMSDRLEKTNQFLKSVFARLPKLPSGSTSSSESPAASPSPAFASAVYSAAATASGEGEESSEQTGEKAEKAGDAKSRESSDKAGDEAPEPVAYVSAGLVSGSLLEESSAGRGRGRGDALAPGAGRGRGLVPAARGRGRGVLGAGRGLGPEDSPPSSEDEAGGAEEGLKAPTAAGWSASATAYSFSFSSPGAAAPSPPADGDKDRAPAASSAVEGDDGGEARRLEGRKHARAEGEREGGDSGAGGWGTRRWKRKPASNVDWLLKCRTKLCELKERTIHKAISDVFIKDRTTQETIENMNHNSSKLEVVSSKPQSEITADDRRVFMRSIESFIAGLEKACALIAKQAMNKRQLMNLFESACKVEKLQTPNELLQEMRSTASLLQTFAFMPPSRDSDSD